MKRRIMVVDDDASVVEAIKTLLYTEGYEIVEAYSGKECLQKLKKNKVDLILLDILMPEMDGWETLRRLKKEGITNTTKVSILTALTQTNENIFDLQDVITDYITKPFAMEQLFSSVRKALSEEGKKPLRKLHSVPIYDS